MFCAPSKRMDDVEQANGGSITRVTTFQTRCTPAIQSARYEALSRDESLAGRPESDPNNNPGPSESAMQVNSGTTNARSNPEPVTGVNQVIKCESKGISDMKNPPPGAEHDGIWGKVASDLGLFIN
ncbi:hypothetical protein QX201_010715 [Fusarium graminearum]